MIGAMTARPPLVLQRKTDCLPRAIETVLRGCRVTTEPPFTSQDVDNLCGWSPLGADICRAVNVLKLFGLEARLALRPMAPNVLDALTRGPVIATVRGLAFEGGRGTHEDTIDAALEDRESYIATRCVPTRHLPCHAVVAWGVGFVGGRKLIDVLCPTLGRGRVTVRRFVDALFMPWIGHDLATWRAGMVDAIEDAGRALGIAEEVARHVARANDWRALSHLHVTLERVREARRTGARWSRREALRQLRAPWNPELWPARSVDGDTIRARAVRLIEIRIKNGDNSC